MSAKEHSFEEESWRCERAYGVLQRSDKAGRPHLLPLEPLFQTVEAAAFSIAFHILRVSPAPTLSLGNLLLLAQLLSLIHSSTASRTSPAQRVVREMVQDLDEQLRPEFQANIRYSRFALME